MFVNAQPPQPSPLPQLRSRHTSLSLNYYKGYFLEPPLHTCSKQCRGQEDVFKAIRDENVNIQVTYSRSVQATKIITKAVTYPTGKAEDLFQFSSYKNVFCQGIGCLHQWMSSSMYHINCSNPVERITAWSHLSVEIVTKICAPQSVNQMVNLTGLQSINLRPPNLEKISQLSHLKTLVLLFHGLSKMPKSIRMLGILAFQTHPIYKICYTPLACEEQDTPLFRGNMTSCATLQTRMPIYHKCTNQRCQQKIGLQFFQDSKIDFILSEMFYNFIHQNNVSVSIDYKWVAHQRNSIMWNRFDKTVKLMSFSKTEHSWMSAAQICAEYGMTLPHLKDKASTRQLVLYVLEKYALPTYALFVGLIRKVSLFEQRCIEIVMVPLFLDFRFLGLKARVSSALFALLRRR